MANQTLQPANDVDWTNCNFVENLDLSGTGLANSQMSGVNLSLSNLEKSQLNNSNLSIGNFIFSNFSNSNLYASNLQGANCNNANFDNANLAKVKENNKLSKLIQENILLRSQVIQGLGNVNSILQKLETGELEIDGDPTLNNNGDGTYTVKMIVKPR